MSKSLFDQCMNKKRVLVRNRNLILVKNLYELTHVFKSIGRKITIDEYVSRIRKARNPDSTKRFKTSQYLTYNQVSINIIRIV